MKKRIKHRSIDVGESTMISLCETCKHMPEGHVPQSNFQKTESHPQQPHMYCSRKAFFPDINYDSEGIPFYDVATCDAYDRFTSNKSKDKTPTRPNIKRSNET